VPSAPVPSPAPEAAPQPNLDPPPDNDWSLRPSDLKMENAAAPAATPAPQATEPPRLIEPGPQKSADDLAVINSVLARMASDMAAKDPGVRAPSTAPAADVASSDMAPPAPTSPAADAKRDAEPASSSILSSIRTGLFKSQPEKTTAPSSDAASAAADAAAGAAAGAAGFGAETVAHEAHHASAFDRPAARSPAADAVALGTAQVPDAMAPEGDAAALAMALARGGFHDAEPMPAPPAAAAEAPPSPPSALRATQEQAPASTPDVGNALADPQAAVAAIAEALAHERVDVFLEPVKHLETQAVRHYEVTVRLRLDDEQKAERAAYSEAASGTPLLPLIDTMAVAHARRVVWRLVDNCNDGRVMTTISGESLSSEQFQKHFGEMSGDGEVMADRLLLSFPQHDVRLFSHRQGLALAKLQALGFRFALDYVSDLDMDFETLIDDGFIFVRLDADVFLNGLPVANGVIPADDICRHFSAFGLTPIVGHIRDQEQLQRLRACGVTLGQGHMLGGARAVLAHWLAGEGA
ncbi:MAG: EAL domain-containing protein, partial [Pseudomonadota bacterium]